MNQRQLIIAIAAASALIIAVAVRVSHNADHKPQVLSSTAPAVPGAAPAPDDTTQWHAPESVEEARERAKKRLEDLNNMTEAQWEAEQQQKRQHAMDIMRQRPSPFGGKYQPHDLKQPQRLPDLTPMPASPQQSQ